MLTLADSGGGRMAIDHTKPGAKGGAPPTEDEDQPAARHVLDDPDVRAKIEDVLGRSERGELRPGKSADDLLRLAREQRRMET
jgi:hypothetical protein